MSSLCCLGLAPQWREKSVRFLLCLHSKRRACSSGSFVPRITSSSTNDDSLGYDPSEDLFGLEANLKPRNATLGARKPRSWFGPNGQYIRELPCPSCRGRGYTPCSECGIERSRSDCSQCVGKGIMTCRQCSGDCVIWEESIDERPWEKARSISPLKMKEDDEVDNLDIKLDVKKKSKRVYQSPPPEVGLKISRSLRSLNAKTGLFSKRMKIIHRDPMLHAQRVAAIKKAKGTAAARKRASEALKVFFSDPENRRKRSIAMKGEFLYFIARLLLRTALFELVYHAFPYVVSDTMRPFDCTLHCLLPHDFDLLHFWDTGVKFYCRHCGREGHRRHYCPELKSSLINRQFVCGVCGEKGHNRRTCPKSRLGSHKCAVRRHHHCKICGQRGHNSRTCPKLIGVKSSVDIKKGFHSSGRRGAYKCKLCQQNGHNSRTCPNKIVSS
ncbi:PREDICTED: zinc [Prunus dulcis]|uniref:PREDICTED: zinc n=1 Tax=Prunus dulcis TaxID=3755 RepID=A0A5E4EXB9_PRUDU|nr:PREDICTED: zinc [Prunus dulcis]